LEYITVKKLSYLNLFTGLTSLTRIEIVELDGIKNIETILDPTKIIFLNVGKVTADPRFLSLFLNLRELQIWDNCERIDFELVLPQMKALTDLRIVFDSSCTPNFVSNIYSHCR
jgi:hypothetical protein